MSSTYSSSLRIELIGSGDQAGAWGATTDSNLAYILDAAVAGYQAVAITSINQALTHVSGPTSSAALNQSVYAMLSFTGATAATNVYIPPASKQYIVRNSSGFTITIYNSTVIGNTTAAGTGISVVNGDKIMVWSDATNVFDLQAQNLTGTLAIAKGGTGQITQQLAINALTGTQTNNRVLRSDGTNATLSQVNVATDVTGTLAIANGGTGVTTLAALGSLFYPVGSIYINATVATNPGTLLGFGTWTAFGAGRVPVGFDSGNVLFDTSEETGGSADSTLPTHTHTTGTLAVSTTTTLSGNIGLKAAASSNATSGVFTATGDGVNYDGGGFYGVNQVSMNANHNHTLSGSTATEGTSGTNANYQPYITVYMWKRTA